jgi:coproporphyrinogen III oxidase-like Fe-S oxidoreductase
LKALKEDKDPIDFEEKLPPDAQIRELLVIALRLRQGVDITSFEAIHGKVGQAIEKAIVKLERDGLLELKGSLVRLSEKGTLFYDTVAVELI